MIRLGYPTQNLTLPASTNRTLRLANLGDAEKVRALVFENLLGLETILRWNAEHGVNLFRIGQSLIPFASHAAFPYDWEAEHGDDLRGIGELARSLGIRLSMHPGQFIQPGSLRPQVSERSLAELRYVARVSHLIGSSDSVIVLHMGGAYEDRAASTARFVETVRSETGVLRYLALENDERRWTVADIVQTACSLDVPAITDAFHHGLNPGGLALREALDHSLPTGKCVTRDRRFTSPAKTLRSKPARTPTAWILKTGTRCSPPSTEGMRTSWSRRRVKNRHSYLWVSGSGSILGPRAVEQNS